MKGDINGLGAFNKIKEAFIDNPEIKVSHGYTDGAEYEHTKAKEEAGRLQKELKRRGMVFKSVFNEKFILLLSKRLKEKGLKLEEFFKSIGHNPQNH